MSKGKAKHPWDSSRPSPKAVRRALEKGDMEALSRALSPRQRMFAKEYIVDFNGAAAAIRAGYSPKYADRQAHILLHHDGVRALIDHLQLSKEAKTMAVNPDWVIQKITANIGTAEDMKNLSAVFRGLELLARHFGMLKDKQEISGPDGEAIRVKQEQVQKTADEMRNLITMLSQKQTFVITDNQENN